MIFCQSDPHWTDDPVGHSDEPFHRVGCAVCAIANAGALKGKLVDPKTLNQRGIRNGRCFLPGSAIVIWNRLALEAGMHMPETKMVIVAKPLDGQKVQQLRERLDEALNAGWFAILGVDHDDDAAPDHYILCTHKSTAGYHCADPATGKEVLVSFTLTAPAGWRGKTHAVLSVKPITG